MDFKSNLQKENREKFDESFVEFTADETTWGAGLYINDKISPVDIKSHEDTLISNTVDKTLAEVEKWAKFQIEMSKKVGLRNKHAEDLLNKLKELK